MALSALSASSRSSGGGGGLFARFLSERFKVFDLSSGFSDARAPVAADAIKIANDGPVHNAPQDTVEEHDYVYNRDYTAADKGDEAS